MTDSREALREVWNADPGHPDRGPLPAVRARLRRGRRARAAAAVVALCSVVGTAVFAVATAQYGDPPAQVTVPPASPAAPELRGLPSYLRPVDPTEAVLRMARPQIVPIGTRSAYEGVGPVSRVVVVFDFEAPLGLPGEPREVRVPIGAQALATDDAATSTAYLSAWAPDGRSWFMAVTADESEVRSSTLDSLIEVNLS
ncbi:hypothetical protein SAMN05443287_107305 [Micromonospora phaseoli]|uniref:Uncharacterized protein n=1 Tax=Micromonospora phaseoli TaxID=1144548 RepID=A0A1H7BSD5_9ACTN|nr:hypothetical protein [Micromonospora phaseoli]PZV94923.1 hypothetical protein CLV64_10858 [Micromonospora phaseoli]GIJ79768.1 hypothetical protein Xph01_42000 [Micromonospora phaseoli]SEJ77542.1 hypothetical protein SAMN05443287_107305 [Micromonospora phaseoli]